MNSVKDSVEYRLAIVEQQLGILKLQQDDFKQLGKELNNLVHKTQMYDASLSDMKERMEDHREAMKSLREEIREERKEFLAAQKDFQKDNAERIDKIQVAILKRIDELTTTTDELKLHQVTSSKKPILNLSDGTFQVILRLVLALVALVAGIYGVKLV